MRDSRMLFAALALACVASRAPAATLLSDSFNTESGGIGTLNYTGFANFNVTAGSVDLVGNGFFDFLPGNGLYVDLDGSTGAAGTLTTKQTFAPGTYALSFSLAGSQRGVDETVTVTFGSLSQTISVAASAGFATETFTAVVTNPSGSTLSFANLVPGDIGALLDNVVVATPAASAPEPASAALVIAGLVGMLGFRSKHKIKV